MNIEQLPLQGHTACAKCFRGGCTNVSERPSHVENCALMRYYEARSGNSLPTFRGHVGSIFKRQESKKSPHSDVLCVISGFCREVDVNCVLLGHSWPLKMGTIGCPQTSVGSYHYTLRNSSEESISYLLHGLSLKSRPSYIVEWIHVPPCFSLFISKFLLRQ